MCIRPLDPRYADPRLPLYSLHLSSTDSWVAHMLYALSEIVYRDFAISDVLSSCQYKNPIPEIPCSKHINDPDYILDSTVMIESRNRTSRFRVSRCQEILTLKSAIPDPRYSMQRFNGPDYFWLDGSDYIAIFHLAKSALLRSSDFVTSKFRSPMPMRPFPRASPAGYRPRPI
jgi:hypothetical protein